MKALSLASVLTIILGVSSAYAASSTVSTTAAKDGVAVEQQLNTKEENYGDVPAYENREVTKDVKEGLKKADAAIRETAEDIKAFFVGDEGGEALEPVMIRRDRTAHGMIDQPVLNPAGKEIAKLKDIIINKDGKAILAVVSDGGLLGIGDKVAAFDYSKVVAQQKDGKVVMALSQEMIDDAANFSYDRKDMAKAKVIPAGSLSINELLDGDLYNAKGEEVGSIENLSFDNGKADRVIVGFNKKMGMGGDFAALNYGALEKVSADDELHLKMNVRQSAQFASFDKAAKK